MSSIIQLFLRCLIRMWLFFPAITVMANATTDSLQMSINGETNDSLKVMHYYRMVRHILDDPPEKEYISQQEYGLALLYGDSGLMLSQNIAYGKGEIEMLRGIASVYYKAGKYDEAIQYNKQSFYLASQYGSNEQKANAMYNIGIAYMLTDQHRLALECLTLVEALADKNAAWETDINESLLRIYRHLDNEEHSVNAGKKALAAAQQIADTVAIANICTSLAESYLLKKDTAAAAAAYETAVACYHRRRYHLYEAMALRDHACRIVLKKEVNRSLDMLHRARNMTERATRNNFTELIKTYRALGDAHQHMGRTDSADYYRKKALQKSLESDVNLNITETYLWLGNRLLETGQPDRAEKHFLLALRYDRTMATRMKIFDRLSHVYRQKNDHLNMVRYARQAVELHDSLLVTGNRERMDILRIQYELKEEREQKELELRTHAEQQQHDIANSRRIIIFSLIILAALTLLLIQLLRNYWSVKKANQKLKESQHEMLLVQEQLNAATTELNRYKTYLEDMVEKKAAEQAQKDLQLFGLANNLSGSFIYRKRTDSNGNEKLAYVSGNILKQYGISAETFMKEGHFTSLWGDEKTDELKELEKKSIPGMEPFKHEFCIAKDGKERWLMICSFPQKGENETLIWDGFVIDISKQKEKERVLKIAKEKAEESDRLKSVFLSNMSHEIRTPMNAIMGFIGFIEKENLSPERRRQYIDTVRSSVDQLLKLVENIIDISKLEIKQLKILPTAFSLNAMMRELENSFSEKSGSKRLFFQLDDSRFVENDIIFTDKTRLRQVLQKLLENAFKYTEKGYVRFGYSEKENDELLFFVEDSGIGISADQQELIFEYFRQSADTELKPKYGGTGLGLSISKGLLEAMNGHIQVRSKPGEGSTFLFTLQKHLKLKK
ncbi:MAG: tetratricopeptide repeat-containing sensor histidine kinase [Bacteroidales bacterium]|jgi:PAS domain S-box-containing protein|nr:tetratricopeptide repeat-containing sensor histidine kinase [Bacteroidales bacterium]